MDAIKTPTLDAQLCFSIYSTSLAITQIYKGLLSPLGLTYPQYLIMLILWEEDGVNLNSICKRLGQQPGALTPVLKRMEQDGVLKRNRSKADERQLEIHLTKQGKQLKTQAVDIQQCVIKSMGLDSVGMDNLKITLDAIRHSIQESSE